MMLASRLCSLHLAPLGRTSIIRVVQNSKLPSTKSTSNELFRLYSNEGRGSWTKASPRRRTIKEIAMQPASGTAINVGTAAVAGGAAVGIGALCFYGLGFASKPGAIDRSMMWPDYVKERIRSTYMYFGTSIALTAASAYACFQSPVMVNLMMKNSFLAIGLSIAAVIGTSMIARSIPYTEGFGMKQAAWALHTSVIGAVIAPICFAGGPLLIRAAWYTAGIVGGLSTVAACAPSEQFLNMAGPLAIGLGVVFAASLGSMFLAPTTALGSGLYSISLYGGLLVFSGFLLYDTQKIIKSAETHSPYAMEKYDPINRSMSIYMDTINIFIRIVSILSNGGSSKRR
ncbi:hypothetical protein LSTR_LSTR008568 [Laodelphax striatellus]|uniref:Growth hormone-inducible transmembrane protein n=1 Tax=Laodelphax striatellus TaxID=195883 RepID=A0A482WWV2_LAOST|nr:hypothetical protein LSTR_LSTR008568 [Laodelphax striatellus]